MGRKQNPLIEEHFVRGDKCDTTSNRYQQTCKSCGEHFPKGRIDSLTNHLTKKCPALTLRQRTQIVFRIHDLGDPDAVHQEDCRQAEDMDNGDLSSAKKHNFEGLNALAEASRRVGGVIQDATGHTQGGLTTGQDVVVDPNLDVLEPMPPFQDVGTEDQSSPMHGMHNSSPSLRALYSLVQPDAANVLQTSTHLSRVSMPIEIGVTSQTSSLRTIAASANATLSDEILPATSDLPGPSDHISIALLNNLTENHRADITSSLPPSTLSVWSSMFGDLSNLPPNSRNLNQDLAGAQLSLGMSKTPALPLLAKPPSKVSVAPVKGRSVNKTPKPRSRFTDDRRVQVKEIRKQGSCLRCRMLKKTCSEETPCRQCRGVDRARLWKHPCIRRRLNESFELFQKNVISLRAHRDIETLRDRVILSPLLGQITASTSLPASSSIIFKALQGQLPIELQTSALIGDIGNFQQAPRIFVIDDAEDVKSKVSRYLKDATEQLVEEEHSHVVQTALKATIELARKNPGNLLPATLELWTAITLLSDQDIAWKFMIDHNSESPESLAHKQDVGGLDPAFQFRDYISSADLPEAHRLLVAQIGGMFDKRMADRGDFVMKELERRLVTRQHASRLEVYLGALILLNSAERMSWLWQNLSSLKSSEWPDSSCWSELMGQGDELAELLDMLLTMRGMHLNTCVDKGSNTIICGEGVDEESVQWLAGLNMAPAWLDEREQAKFDPHNFRCFDGKLFARIVRPKI